MESLAHTGQCWGLHSLWSAASWKPMHVIERSRELSIDVLVARWLSHSLPLPHLPSQAHPFSTGAVGISEARGLGCPRAVGTKACGSHCPEEGMENPAVGGSSDQALNASVTPLIPAVMHT